MNNLIRNTITSMEVAEMVGKEHSKLLRDIRNYVVQLGEAKLDSPISLRKQLIQQSRIRFFHVFRSQRKAVSSLLIS